jgi:hypothetical protein
MRKALFCTSIAVMLSLTFVLDAWAGSFEMAPPQGNWNKVQSLNPGVNLTVHLKGGEIYIGEFVRLGGDSILMKVVDREREFPKSSVSRIGLMRQGSRRKNAAIAGGVVGAIGFGIGCAVAARAMDQNSASAGERMAIGVAMGGVWGGIAAAIAAAHKPGVHEEIVFQSR